MLNVYSILKELKLELEHSTSLVLPWSIGIISEEMLELVVIMHFVNPTVDSLYVEFGLLAPPVLRQVVAADVNVLATECLRTTFDVDGHWVLVADALKH